MPARQRDPAPRPPARHRAPSHDGGTLVEPTPIDLLRLVETNRAALPEITLGGLPLGEVAAAARARLVADATRYTAAYLGDLTPTFPAGAPLVVSGHQPELFHPGVWFKNFALDQIARRSGAAALHLLIDSDLCRGASIRVPAGPRDSPRWDTVAYDALGAATPHEERRVLDPTLFESFPARLAQSAATLGLEPLAAVMWPAALDAAGRHGVLGRAVSEARHMLETRWGSRTLELPLADVCDAPEFGRFVLELVSRADVFRTAYNTALADYRRAHRIRTAAQPVPDLHQRDGWVECALWVWSASAPVRRALWARRVGATIELSDGADWRASLSSDPTSAIDQLAALRCRGVKLRSRALTTTLYARLVLADLFLHGIGGAKYDEVTDLLAERFFGFAPPAHATLTATLRLPIATAAPPGGGIAEATAKLRAMRYHPERFAVAASPSVVELIAEKQRFVGQTPPRGAGAERRHAIDRVNRALAAGLAAERARLEGELGALARDANAAAVVASREVSFAYFPEADLRARLPALARRAGEAD
ncbi:MAG: hypothetical protein ACRCT8_01660 [Lacipirellulaceae bacterium]